MRLLSCKTAGAALRLAAVPLLLFWPGAALAHGGPLPDGGFISGLMHPLLGWDHVAAMVAVGLWAATLGAGAAPVLLAAFPLAMVAGGVAGRLGLALPMVEAGIAASSVVIGVALLLALRPPVWLAGLVVAGFAAFHGRAHGAEMPASGHLALYATGFVLSTLLLHGGGLALGLLAHRPAVCRVIGAGIAAGGAGALLFP
ncbi:HupE/UreJ family protein [Paracoccus sp. DMF]|uniref:HupE/UreJ family protein n=1 Tax=Paracoccus sp. DMF TaxID=400837 RepID=UPI0021E4E408|nr:HupE/UreJ family protein [Paracoccus sp. DMF]MCV2445708.1 HupE/UreJ family protein [Paracoccus sp. DMF]